MNEFSAVEAALSGFRLALKRPLLVLAWAGISFVATIVFFGLLALLFFPAFKELAAVSAGGATEPDPTTLMRAVLPMYLLLIPFGLLVGAIQQCAVNRVILTPEKRGFAYLKIGGDEWRQILLSLVYILLGICWVVGWVAVNAVTGLALRDAGGLLVGFIVQLLLFGLFIFLMVRLSLGSALTFTTKRVNVFGSWAATKGRFWPILGAYLLSFVLAIAAVIVMYLVMGIVMLIAFGGNFAALSAGSDPEAMAKVFTPTIIILYLLALPFMQIFGIVINLGMLAPAPDILRQTSTETSVFD